MKKIVFSIIFATSLFASTYEVDTKNSNITFEVSKFMFVNVTGEFKEFSGTLKTNQKNQLTNITGFVNIDSINTEDEKRDKHLKEADYFDLVLFPTIKFNSLDIKDAKLNAQISMKGISKNITFEIDKVEVFKEKILLKLHSTVKRDDFKLDGSMSAVVSNDVDVYANIEAFKIK